MKKFIRERKGDQPEITIRKHGEISINRVAVKQFPIKDCSYATLYYDEKEKLIGIKPTSDEKEDSAFKIFRERGSTPSFSCQSFLNAIGLAYKESSKSYPVIWDEKRGMIIVKVE